jgi:hypothetical protein
MNRPSVLTPSLAQRTNGMTPSQSHVTIQHWLGVVCWWLVACWLEARWYDQGRPPTWRASTSTSATNGDILTFVDSALPYYLALFTCTSQTSSKSAHTNACSRLRLTFATPCAPQTDLVSFVAADGLDLVSVCQLHW